MMIRPRTLVFCQATREPMILLVKPAPLMATRWKFMEHTSACGASTRRRADSYAVARTALNIAVAPRRQTTSALTLRGAPFDCVPLSLDRYGRSVATCSVDGADLGEWLVRNGLALDWVQYSKGRYSGAQRDAERAGRGIWKGTYVEPWLYRACIRASGKPSDCSDDANAYP
jgi:hypothetical protein